MEELLLLNLQAETCKFTKSNTNPWVFFTFFNLHKWYQIVQSVLSFLNSFLNSPPYDALNVFVCERNCCAAINSAFVCDVKESTDIPFSCETTEAMII